MDLRSRLEALRGGSPRSEDPSHALVDAVLRSLAAEEIEAIRRVLERWVAAGHAPDSAPESSDLEPDDTGNVIDPGSKSLIAMPDEWAVYQRVHAALGETGR